MSIEALRLISKGLHSMGIPVVIHNENTNINDYEKLDILAVHKHLLIREIDFIDINVPRVFTNDPESEYFSEDGNYSENNERETYLSRIGVLVNQFQVFIKDLDGKVFTIFVGPLMTVLHLKRKIKEKKSYPVDGQRLIFNGKDLEDYQLLSSYDIQEHSIIQVLFRLRGGKLYVLDPKDLAPEYDYVYPSSETTTYTRGGCNFIRPCGWLKYGIKVLGKYENDTWMGTGDDAWPVSYHGTSKENAISIAHRGYDSGKTAKHGRCHGNGVYSSPYPNFAERYAGLFEDDGKRYKFMFMNRLDMNYTKIENNGNEFITSKDDHVRPYAYLLKQY